MHSQRIVAPGPPLSKGHECLGCGFRWYKMHCELEPSSCLGNRIRCPECSERHPGPWFYASTENLPELSQVDGAW